MRWLVTLKKDLTVEEINNLLSQHGCEPIDQPAIPLGDTEQAVEVSGPEDLPKKTESEEKVLKVSPNSDFTLY